MPMRKLIIRWMRGPEELTAAASDRGVRWVDNYDMRFVTGGWDDVASGEEQPE